MPKGTERAMKMVVFSTADWNREFVRVSIKFYKPTNFWAPMLSTRA